MQEPTEQTQIDLMQGSDKGKTTYVKELTWMKVDLTQESDSDCGECHWDGTVNHYISESGSNEQYSGWMHIMQVHAFSSKKYKSHCHIPEHIAQGGGGTGNFDMTLVFFFFSTTAQPPLPHPC